MNWRLWELIATSELPPKEETTERGQAMSDQAKALLRSRVMLKSGKLPVISDQVLLQMTDKVNERGRSLFHRE